jgi:hypothetical protein
MSRRRDRHRNHANDAVYAPPPERIPVWLVMAHRRPPRRTTGAGPADKDEPNE